MDQKNHQKLHFFLNVFPEESPLNFFDFLNFYEIRSGEPLQQVNKKRTNLLPEKFVMLIAPSDILECATLFKRAANLEVLKLLILEAR